MNFLQQALEAAELLDERQQLDGCAALSCYTHQDQFLRSTKSEAWLFGANRSGKTRVLAAFMAGMLRFGRPDPRPAYIGNGNWVYDQATKLWGISLTYEMSRNILQPNLFDNGALIPGVLPMVPPQEVLDWNITNQTLKLKNGSIAIFKSGDGGQKVFQGEGLDGIAFDEVPRQEVYKECLIRVGGGRRLLIRGAATILPPPGVPGGISWMFNAKVRPWLDRGAVTEERNENSPDLDIFTAALHDNPAILPEEIARLEAAYPPGSQEARIRIYGELLPSIGGSLVYTSFSRQFHCSTDLYLIPYYPLCLACDFNAENGRWLVGQKYGEVFRVLDVIRLERSDIASMVQEFRSKYPTHGAELLVYGDTMGRRLDAQTGLSNFHLIQNYMTNYPVPIRFVLPDLNPPEHDRINAVNMKLRDPQGRKLIEIDPVKALDLVEDLEQSLYNKKGKIDKRNGRRSDAADALGYWISTDSPAVRYGMPGLRTKSITTPNRANKRTFPASHQQTVRRIDNHWFLIGNPRGRAN